MNIKRQRNNDTAEFIITVEATSQKRKIKPERK
jgi:hypothetical protein